MEVQQQQRESVISVAAVAAGANNCDEDESNA